MDAARCGETDQRHLGRCSPYILSNATLVTAADTLRSMPPDVDIYDFFDAPDRPWTLC